MTQRADTPSQRNRAPGPQGSPEPAGIPWTLQQLLWEAEVRGAGSQEAGPSAGTFPTRGHLPTCNSGLPPNLTCNMFARCPTAWGLKWQGSGAPWVKEDPRTVWGPTWPLSRSPVAASAAELFTGDPPA